MSATVSATTAFPQSSSEREASLSVALLAAMKGFKIPASCCALMFADAGIAVFPCHAEGQARKQPIGKLVPHGCLDATRNRHVIRDWWRERPNALIGGRTGLASGFVVLDVDVKDPAAFGFDTLAELGFAILPDTVMAHTPSGGLHLWFDPQGREIPNTQGARGQGIGPGLDWRGENGYVILPSANSGYWSDPHCRSELAPVPIGLLPREPERPKTSKPASPVVGLSPYAKVALDSACRKIIAAPAGSQEATINSESFSIGTLAGAGAIPEAFARGILLWGARKIPDYDTHRPWRAAELETKVNRAFDAGMRSPRGTRHG